MDKKIEEFAKHNEKIVYKYKLTNKNGVSISCLSYGAILYEFTNEDNENMILNYSNFNEYEINPISVGLTIGRTAGRIKKAQFELDDKIYQLDVNEGDHTLHGGPNGFGKLMWQGQIKENTITFKQKILEKDDKYPGDLQAIVSYTLTDDNEVVIDYEGISNKDSVFNPTCHTYFNLNLGNENVLNHSLQVNSDKYLELKNSIPTDETIDITNTAFDFKEKRKFSEAVTELSKAGLDQFDDIWIVNDHHFEEPIATLENEKNKIEIKSDRNALVMYLTTNFDKELQFVDRTSQPYIGVALEAQEAPNAISNERFGNIKILGNIPAKHQIIYKYSKKDVE